MPTELHSELSREQILACLRGKTRDWSRLDMWTARGVCFLRERKDGATRLIRTGDGLGYVYADMTICENPDGGTTLVITTGVPKTMLALGYAVPLALLFLLVIGELLLWRRITFRTLVDMPICGLLAWQTWRTVQSTPKLMAFIEEHLLRL